jgi:predicted KAP-like P-loop ATPase
MRLSDNPIQVSGDDEFGFSEHAEVLCDAIMQTQDLPLTVGIFGPWGSGKSSFLNICHDLLEKREFVTVKFNPWKYDKRDEIWHALIQSLLAELIKQAEDELKKQAEGSPAHNRLQEAIKDAWKLRGLVAVLVARSIVPLLTLIIHTDS